MRVPLQRHCRPKWTEAYVLLQGGKDRLVTEAEHFYRSTLRGSLVSSQTMGLRVDFHTR